MFQRFRTRGAFRFKKRSVTTLELGFVVGVLVIALMIGFAPVHSTQTLAELAHHSFIG